MALLSETIVQYRDAARKAAAMQHALDTARIERAKAVRDGIAALVGEPNDLTGRPHSVASATDAVKSTDEDYRRKSVIADLERQIECHRIDARVAELTALGTVRAVG